MRGAADAAGEEARRAAGDVAEETVRRRVCEAVGDGQVSEAEVVALRVAVAAAEAAGAPEEITSAARDVIGTGGRPSEEAVRRLEDACRR